MSGFTIASSAASAIVKAARDAMPHEACGLLLGDLPGRGTHVAIAQSTRNVHPDPARRFEIDPGALIAALRAECDGGPRVVGFFHSHPTGSPVPSPTDRALAAPDGRLWAIAVPDGTIGWFESSTEGLTRCAVAIKG